MTGTAVTPTLRLDRSLALLWGTTCTAAVVLFALSAALGSSLYGIPVVLALLLALALAGSLVLAVVLPVVAAGTSAAAVIALALAGSPETGSPWPVAVPTTIAFAVTLALVVLRSDWRPGFIAWVVGVAGASVVGIAGHRPPASGDAATADLIVFAAVSGVLLGVAVLVSRWQDVRRQLLREQQLSASEHARLEVAEERTRIARELHDVVAHGMSAIQVQASSARYRLPELPEDAAREFDELAATARASMGEMRRLLGVLRHEGGADLAPQPGLADVPALVADASRHGEVVLDAELAHDDPARSDPVLGLAAYRIVQESLSNVARHATGAPVHVRIERTAADIRVEVRNGRAPGRPASAPAPIGGGHGIRGMRERAGLLDGTLTAEAVDDGFVVVAVLPVPTVTG
ncbi:sensor histidine kinase [Leifsonia shinshuensis]|uniref:sensor histidine kinase n=1 Tax=Leifsonia shinshuensis TaxID=150026 RepID=UPI001F50E3B4|nr:sensor histidine kinase [Leifsonia shinshuensis]MCI0155614.1 sensor histidine kinase [Leifsonia shinshuensis]